jgi:hypothetical protein
LYSLSGSKLNPKDASSWFKVFYQGSNNPIYLPYTDSEIFENPSAFRLDDFADDESMIRPYFLPVGMSTYNRIIKPGYESYQPVVVARQFGFGQVPPTYSSTI